MSVKKAAVPRLKRTPELAKAILAKLEEGDSLRAVCRMKEMPSKAFVLDWLEADQDFAAQYTRARERGWDTRAEAAVDDAKVAKDATRGRLAFDAERWYLGKMAPKKYGEKVQQEISGPDGGPIETRYASYDDAALDDLIRKKLAEAQLG